MKNKCKPKTEFMRDLTAEEIELWNSYMDTCRRLKAIKKKRKCDRLVFWAAIEQSIDYDNVCTCVNINSDGKPELHRVVTEE